MTPLPSSPESASAVRREAAHPAEVCAPLSRGQPQGGGPALSPLDRLLVSVGRGMATLASGLPAARPNPAAAQAEAELTPAQRALAAALMRVNHVGEVCAQALYDGQAAGTRNPVLREAFQQAAQEEIDHLAWTRERIAELGGRPSLLNPVWYAGAFGLGLLASRAGDGLSLGFMAETERQVERHLESHLERLPAEDVRSRAVVARMKDDEAAHARSAESLGGVTLPAPVRAAMRVAARVMTATAHRI